MNNNDLMLLVRACLQNAGQLSIHRRKQLIAKGHPAAVLDLAQQAVTSDARNATKYLATYAMQKGAG